MTVEIPEPTGPERTVNSRSLIVRSRPRSMPAALTFLSVTVAILNERQCRYLYRNACGLKLGSVRVGAALYVGQRDFFVEVRAFRCARDPAEVFPGFAWACEPHAGLQRRARERDQAAQALVSLPRHLHSRNNFLPDIA